MVKLFDLCRCCVWFFVAQSLFVEVSVRSKVDERQGVGEKKSSRGERLSIREYRRAKTSQGSVLERMLSAAT